MHIRPLVACTLAGALVAAAGPARAEFAPHLVSIEAGGGVTDFRSGQFRANTDTGGSWDVAATIGTRSRIALELDYAGTAQQIVDPIGTTGLVSNAVEGMGRINLVPFLRVQPFVVGGLGYAKFHVSGGDDFTRGEFAKNTDVMVVPVGGGLSTYLGEHGLIDARFTYRFIPKSTMSNDIEANTTARPDDWTVMVRGGYAF